jgi:hypothetical protein
MQAGNLRLFSLGYKSPQQIVGDAADLQWRLVRKIDDHGGRLGQRQFLRQFHIGLDASFYGRVLHQLFDLCQFIGLQHRRDTTLDIPILSPVRLLVPERVRDDDEFTDFGCGVGVKRGFMRVLEVSEKIVAMNQLHLIAIDVILDDRLDVLFMEGPAMGARIVAIDFDFDGRHHGTLVLNRQQRGGERKDRQTMDHERSLAAVSTLPIPPRYEFDDRTKPLGAGQFVPEDD